MIGICRDWEYTNEWTEGFAKGEAGTFEKVTLPHNVGGDLPLHYTTPGDYERVCGYRKYLDEELQSVEKAGLPFNTESAEGAKGHVFLQFDGAAHIAEVYVNGEKAGEHRCGYTAFRVEITEFIKQEEKNLVAVKLDTTENASVPPFGFVVDYLTYGGLYRDAWLDVKGSAYIEDVFVTTPKKHLIHTDIQAKGDFSGARVSVIDAEGKCVGEATFDLTSDVDGSASASAKKGVQKKKSVRTEVNFSLDIPLKQPRLWGVDDPYLYRLRVELMRGWKAVDTQETSFGVRSIRFKKDGFYLNGKKLFLHGLNRHQSYPYIGYAATESLQREDARIVKEELGCNFVRTSHYPQSQYFLDECDKIGLLVFTEIPGWQHIGDEAWKEQAIENTKEMILQNRNHPSIILWGVRINESQDDDAFYKRTNACAHALDKTRQTSGVRYITKSSFLEDVYSFNDFSHNGQTPSVLPKENVMKEKNKPLLISECNGHMYPTKSFDPWERRLEHALRHARVLDGAMASGEHAGCVEWCMFDYQTHKDFGSGDRICYHGVLDHFRNPKLAAALHASQSDHEPVLEIGTSMDIGDYPGGVIGDVWAFTNADEVRLYKNDVYVACFKPNRKRFAGLAHPPVLIDDMIGELPQTLDGFSKEKCNDLKKCLQSAVKYGINTLPAKEKARFGMVMLKHHLTFEDGVALYGKYVGGWGGGATVWRFEAARDGKVVKIVTKGAGHKLRFEVTSSATKLTETNTYDMACVRIRITDEYGNITPYAQLPVRLALTGAAQLVGPAVVTAEGGMCATYVRTCGKKGKALLKIVSTGLESAEVEFEVG